MILGLSSPCKAVALEQAAGHSSSYVGLHTGCVTLGSIVRASIFPYVWHEGSVMTATAVGAAARLSHPSAALDVNSCWMLTITLCGVVPFY